MPAARKRENRENHFYNVGEQGRKTGIRLEDRGVRDEHGMEPVSGIFSSPERSPPKRSVAERNAENTVTESESMDIQESSIPDLTPGHILRNNLTNLPPPPRSRSPMKTALGATPRRSIRARAQSVNNESSSDRPVADAAVSRRLDFEQEESSLQETPALSGSGTRREIARHNVYDVELSPIPAPADDVSINDISDMLNGFAEESFDGAVGEDPIVEIQDIEGSLEMEESVVEAEWVQQSLKRGRKRKSDTLEPAADNESPAAPPKKTRTKNVQSATTEKTSQPPIAKPRGRPPKKPRISEATEEESSIALNASVDDSVLSPVPAPIKARGRKAQVDDSVDDSVQEEEAPAPVAPKRRGRRPNAQADDSVLESKQVEKPAPATKPRGRPPTVKTSKSAPAKEAANQAKFKKPKAVSKAKGKDTDKPADAPNIPTGKLVDLQGNPLTKADLDQMSTTSAGSRFRRTRTLSVFRELAPGESGSVGRTGRHHIAPVNFWKNERAAYDVDGNLLAVVQNESLEESPKKKAAKRWKGKKKALADIEEDEVEPEDWEIKEGVFVGAFRDFDAATETASDQQYEGALAWAESGINPLPVANAQFKFTKMGSAGSGSYFSWGCIDFDEDDIKRSKNSRRMHMAFHVTKGAVEVIVNENVFTIRKGGVWQVPRGNSYSIRNVAKKSRVFFAQAFESTAKDDI